LCANQEFASFHLHLAMDPDCGDPHIPCSADRTKLILTASQWLEDRKDLEKLVAEANVYFAPRPYEGIGMAFLEAMARGQCVVAPNAPTMSEYMTHGISGLFYDVENPHPLDFCAARKIGANARRTIERGFKRWQYDQSDILPAYLFGEYKNAFLMGETAHRRPQPSPPRRDGIPMVAGSSTVREGGRRITGYQQQNTRMVTVAIVVRNGAAGFLDTLSSVLAQSYCDKEVIVIDGDSDDGTLDLIRNKSDVLDYWKSERDEGPYDGMNKAADVAIGRYILFMNAGDEFAYPDALAEAMEDIRKIDPDFIIGHHIYVKESSVEELHKASDFACTWSALTEGVISSQWYRDLPCHQATLTRTALLRERRYDTNYHVAADLEFLCRQRAAGARVHNCDVLLAVYFGGGFSSRNEALCHREWIEIVRLYGGRKNADELALSIGEVPTFQDKLKRLAFPFKWALGVSSSLLRKFSG
ncbi:MAG TPA: glycosyltransferase, partial [Methylocella sp.]|nr:glycosyltransferase [Methylocella sp.]